MQVFLGDEVTVFRKVGEDETFATGRISGVVLKDSGDLNYFYLKGITSAFWISDGWSFIEEETEDGEI